MWCLLGWGLQTASYMRFHFSTVEASRVPGTTISACLQLGGQTSLSVHKVPEWAFSGGCVPVFSCSLASDRILLLDGSSAHSRCMTKPPAGRSGLGHSCEACFPGDPWRPPYPSHHWYLSSSSAGCLYRAPAWKWSSFIIFACLEVFQMEAHMCFESFLKGSYLPEYWISLVWVL